jgi:pentose-5-phosphate-3-epimerase
MAEPATKVSAPALATSRILSIFTSYITFHPEASEHIDRTLGMIKEAGCKAGLVFNPATPLQVLENVMDKLDMILLINKVRNNSIYGFNH